MIRPSWLLCAMIPLCCARISADDPWQDHVTPADVSLSEDALRRAEACISVISPHGVRIPENAGYDALVFVNFDHDGAQDPDQSDSDDEVINGAEDRDDMAVITLERPAGDTHGRYILQADNTERLRFFDEDGVAVPLTGSGNFLLNQERFQRRGMLQFLAEGVKPGVVNITLGRAGSVGRPAMESRIRVVVGVEVMLTFDDGPVTRVPAYSMAGQQASGINPQNATAIVLKKLKDPSNGIPDKNIKACFFVALGMDAEVPEIRTVAYRKETRRAAGAIGPYAKEILTAQERDGHLFGYHRVAGQGYAEGGLRGDIRALKAYFQGLNLPQPFLVRPHNWQRDPISEAMYASEKLGVMMTDVRSRDGGFSKGNSKGWVLVIRRTLRNGVRDRIREGMGQIVVTFHDVNPTTAKNLSRYLRDLLKGGRLAGLPEGAVVLVNDSMRLEALLTMKARKEAFAYNRVPRPLPREKQAQIESRSDMSVRSR